VGRTTCTALTVRPNDAGRGAAIRTVPVVLLVRAAVPSDWPAIGRIYAEGIATGDATFETERPSWDAWDASHLPTPRLVAEDAGEVVGWIAVSPVSRRDVYGGVVEHSVYVAEAARGRGVGRTLLAALIEEAPSHGIWTIQTSIFEQNVATVALHTAAGFRVVGRRERIAQLGGEWRDTLLLELRLP
jgi:phosphinothricin acetyltransferase